MRDLIGWNNLSNEIVFVIKELNNILEPFGLYLYKTLNKSDFKYSVIAERLSDQRNCFAHGNLEKDFSEDSILDIIFMKIIVLAIQLKRAKLSDDNIKKAINNLFDYHLMFEKSESFDN